MNVRMNYIVSEARVKLVNGRLDVVVEGSKGVVWMNASGAGKTAVAEVVVATFKALVANSNDVLLSASLFDRG